jgi:hypothetical protein
VHFGSSASCKTATPDLCLSLKMIVQVRVPDAVDDKFAAPGSLRVVRMFARWT